MAWAVASVQRLGWHLRWVSRPALPAAALAPWGPGDEVQQSCSLLEREHARAGTGRSGTGTEREPHSVSQI